MALADYRLCDKCGSKTFYDAGLPYDFIENRATGLDRLGDWACICTVCAKRWQCVVVERPADTAVEQHD